MTPLPPDLQQTLDDIDAADRAADPLAAACTDERFHWRPAVAGFWSRMFVKSLEPPASMPTAPRS